MQATHQVIASVNTDAKEIATEQRAVTELAELQLALVGGGVTGLVLL